MRGRGHEGTRLQLRQSNKLRPTDSKERPPGAIALNLIKYKAYRSCTGDNLSPAKMANGDQFGLFFAPTLPRWYEHKLSKNPCENLPR